jgi:hypothetical protein
MLKCDNTTAEDPMATRKRMIKIRRRFCVVKCEVTSFINSMRRTPTTAMDSNSVTKRKPNFGTPIAIRKEVTVSVA